jgi:hypothetical protein
MQSKSPRLLVSLSFLLSGVVTAAGIGIAAASVSLMGWAPVGIFSLGVGIVVGVAASTLARWLQVDCRRRLTVATLLMALVAVAAEHAWLYRDYRQQWQVVRQREPALALFRPDTEPLSLGKYFAAESSPSQMAFWGIDAALVAAAALGALVVLRRTDTTNTSCSVCPPPTPGS